MVENNRFEFDRIKVEECPKMKNDHGWAGKILVIDLSTGHIEIVPTSAYAERFIGGIGIASKILWDRMDPDAGALSPDNCLIFSTGPLTGTAAPASGRFELMGKSPTTYPREVITRSGLGGMWGPELKYCGFDALVVSGKAPVPVYLWIEDGKAEIRDAGDLWGMDTYRTQEIIQNRHDPEAKVLCIGKAGENLVRFAAIISETSFASGKSGFGAVMGSKNLKAICARGKQALSIARPQELMDLAKQIRLLTARNPVQEWTQTPVYPDYRRAFWRRYRDRNTSCFGCPIPCFAFVKVPGVGNCQIHCTMSHYEKLAYAYQQNTEEWGSVFWDFVLSINKHGLCTFELRGIMYMLLEMYQQGTIKDKDVGIPLSRYGSREFFSSLLDIIVERRGVGDLLAEGAPRAAEKIPKAWDAYEKFHPAHGEFEHDSVREFPAIALMWALDSRDPLIDHHAYRHLAVTRQRWPEPHRLPHDRAVEISKEIFGSDLAIDHTTYDGKAQAVFYAQNRSAVINLLVLCDWLYPIFQSQVRPDRKGDTSMESKLLSAVTGYQTTEAALNHAGERVWNLMRCIAVREGQTRKNDTLHASYFRPDDRADPQQQIATEVFVGPAGQKKAESQAALRAVPKAAFEKAKDEYYRIRGWDERTGWPTGEKLKSLGLDDVVQELSEKSLFPK